MKELKEAIQLLNRWLDDPDETNIVSDTYHFVNNMQIAQQVDNHIDKEVNKPEAYHSRCVCIYCKKLGECAPLRNGECGEDYPDFDGMKLYESN